MELPSDGGQNEFASQRVTPLSVTPQGMPAPGTAWHCLDALQKPPPLQKFQSSAQGWPGIGSGWQVGPACPGRVMQLSPSMHV